MVFAGLAAGLSPATGAGPAAAPAAVSVPVLDWQPCAHPSQEGFDCTTAAVPMDYSQPAGDSFTLALIRKPAQGPGSRIGALF
jgi:hypothetical protein